MADGTVEYEVRADTSHIEEDLSRAEGVVRNAAQHIGSSLDEVAKSADNVADSSGTAANGQNQFAESTENAANKSEKLGSALKITGAAFAAIGAAAATVGTRYTGGKLTIFSGTTVTEKEITVEIFTSTPESTVYRIYINGTQAGSYTTYNPEVMGFVIQWENINGTKSEATPYGYAYASLYALSEGSTGTIGASAITGLTRINIPFISEAEYNAAVGLTYEPNVLTEVQETVTEV